MRRVRRIPAVLVLLVFGCLGAVAAPFMTVWMSLREAWKMLR